MGKLVVDGNKVYTVDEACMRRKKLTLAQVRDTEAGRKESSGENHPDVPASERKKF